MPLSIGGNSVESLALTRAWGLSPASGNVNLLGGAPEPGAEASLTVDGFTFHGIVRSRRLSTTFTGGKKFSVQLLDYRLKLRDDVVFGYFNRPDPSNSGGDDAKKRRFTHVFPEDWDKYSVTVTEKPLTAQEILETLFEAPTVTHSWQMQPHNALLQAVFDVDAEKGKELGALIQEILDDLGLILTIDSKVDLRVGVKGRGEVPGIPDGYVSSEIGEAMTDFGTNVHIVGDRNVFQGTFDLRPGWNAGWEDYPGEEFLGEAIKKFEEFDDSKVGQAMLAERVRTITVSEMATKIGKHLVDFRHYGDAVRMDIPAWVYVHEILYQYYEIDPEQFPFDLESVRIRESLLQGLIYSIETGQHKLKEGDYYPENGAFITAKGQPLKDFDPDRIGEVTPELVEVLSTTWQSITGFRIVNGRKNNKGIHFNGPIYFSKDWMTFPNEKEEKIPDEVRHIAVPKEDAEIKPAEVKASLAIEHAIFHFNKGSGTRQDVVYQAGLAQHIVSDSTDRVAVGTDITGGDEIVYSDDEKAIDKAKELADVLLDREPVILSGGYTRVGHAGTTLAETIDRVTVNLNFNQGLTETVDFADERRVKTYDSERELERRRKSKALFPGQKELKRAAEEYRVIAENYRLAETGKNHRYHSLGDVRKQVTTCKQCSPKQFANPELVEMNAGEVIWIKGSNKEEEDETSSDSIDTTFESTRFAGVAIVNKSAKSAIHVATQGIVPVLVQGPVDSGETVGCEVGERFAVAGGERIVGTAIDSIPDDRKILIRVEVSTGAGGAKSCVHWKPKITEEGLVWKDGLINDVTATNIGKPVEYDPENENLTYIYADVQAGSGTLQFEIKTGNEPVSSASEEEAEVPPSTFQVGLGYISAGRVTMTRCRNLVAVPVETRRSGGTGELDFTRHFTWAVLDVDRQETDYGYYID